MNPEIKQNIQNNQDNQNNQNDLSLREKCIDEYMGPKAPIFKNGDFSYATLFFGWIYLFYRKMYKVGIILLVINFIASFLFIFLINYYAFYMVEIVLLFIQFILGGMFGQLYVKQATNFVNQRISENLSEEEIINVCRRKGGVDSKAFLVMIGVGVVNTLLYNLSNSILRPPDLVIHFPQGLQSNLATRNEYEYKQGNNNYYKMEFSYNDGESSCSFTVNKTDKFKAQKNGNTSQVYDDFIKDFHMLSVKTVPQTFHDITLYTYEDLENNTCHYLYASKLNMNEIVIEVHKDNNGKCTTYKDYILNNLQIGN